MSELPYNFTTCTKCSMPEQDCDCPEDTETDYWLNQPQQQSIVLTITLVPGQPVNVSGPLNDKGLSYMMLELARDAIQMYEPSPIIPVSVVPRLKLAN